MYRIHLLVALSVTPLLAACDGTSAEDSGRADFVTFALALPDGSLEGYYYMMVEDTYSHQDDCGLFGLDFEGVARRSDGVSSPISDSRSQGSNTYIQYFATRDGQLCNNSSNSRVDAQFEFGGVRFTLFGSTARPFPNLREIVIPPGDAFGDRYASGESWSRDDDSETGGDGYNWFFWPYEYAPPAP